MIIDDYSWLFKLGNRAMLPYFGIIWCWFLGNNPYFGIIWIPILELFDQIIPILGLFDASLGLFDADLLYWGYLMTNNYQIKLHLLDDY